jgi:protein-tyrosine-phosphatase
MTRKLDIRNPYPPFFSYADQDWVAVWGVISPPYNSAGTIIQEKLETCAMRYQLANEQDFSRKDTVISMARSDASEIADVCSRLEHLLLQWGEKWFPDGSIDAHSNEQKKRHATFFEVLGGVKAMMESTMAQGIPYGKDGQKDPYRDMYLSQLCEIWVETLGRPLTASFNRRSGEASGPCVEFLYRAATPVLGGFTRNSARRFIQRMKKEKRAGTGPLIRIWKTHRHG